MGKYKLAFAAPAFAQEKSITSDATINSAENDTIEPTSADLTNTTEETKHPRFDALREKI